MTWKQMMHEKRQAEEKKFREMKKNNKEYNPFTDEVKDYGRQTNSTSH